jgi:hypothetical protein
MSALLNDVDAALKEEANANINLCTGDVAKGDTREAEARDTETNVHSVVDEEENTDGVAAKGVDVDMDDGGAAKGVAVDTKELCSDYDDIDNTNFELLAREAREDNLSHSTFLDAPQAAVIVYEGGAEDIRDQNTIDSPVRSPAGSDRTRSASFYGAPNSPRFDLFPKGSDDWLRHEKTPDSPSHVATTSPLPVANISGVDKPATTGC